jgi:putative ABC transport system permease protein
MIQNFFKVAIRNLTRQRGYTFINIIGLSVGLASALIIFMFVFEELNYDRFYAHSKNIYRAYLKGNIGSSTINGAYTPAPMAAALKSDFPEVKLSSRLMDNDNLLVSVDEKYYNIKHSLYVDSTFLQIFDLPLITGNPVKVLTEPRTAVLSETTSKMIFGKADPINKLIRVETDTFYYRVTGIMKDLPSNTHMDADILLSFHSLPQANGTFWLSNSFSTYVLLPDGYPYKQLEAKFPEWLKKYIGPQLKEALGISLEEFANKGNTYGYFLQPLLNIHLNTEISHSMKPSNSKKYLYIFSVIGLFVILIASINFMNLSTARSVNRSREVGLRKVLGSDRKKLIFQFLAESVLICLISMAIAVILLEIVLPLINNSLQLHLGFELFKLWQIIIVSIAFAVLIGLFAGFYPAFMLSSFKPSTIFKDKLKSGSKGSFLRSLLVVVQFIIAIFILSGTLIVYSQLKYMQNKDLGFDKERVMIIDRAGALEKKLKPFMQELKKFPSVLNSTSSTSIPGFPNNNNGYLIEGREAGTTFLMTTNFVDADYESTYKFTIKEGRFFSPDRPADSSAIVINEAAVKKFDLKTPIGTRFMQPIPNGKFNYLTVIGIVKDFHYSSLHSIIEPYVMILKPKDQNYGGNISLRLAPGNLNKAIRDVESVWKQFTNGQPIQYSFLDDRLMGLYKEEKRTGSLALGFTILAVLIACLGLLGLISYSTVQRTKEMGIRKILGASVSRIVYMLSTEIIRLIIISSIIAWPVAYLLLKNWLNDFAYKIGLNPAIFLLTTVIIFILSLFTIGYQALYAATRNPSESLRYE